MLPYSKSLSLALLAALLVNGAYAQSSLTPVKVEQEALKPISKADFGVLSPAENLGDNVWQGADLATLQRLFSPILAPEFNLTKLDPFAREQLVRLFSSASPAPAPSEQAGEWLQLRISILLRLEAVKAATALAQQSNLAALSPATLGALSQAVLLSGDLKSQLPLLDALAAQASNPERLGLGVVTALLADDREKALLRVSLLGEQPQAKDLADQLGDLILGQKTKLDLASPPIALAVASLTGPALSASLYANAPVHFWLHLIGQGPSSAEKLLLAENAAQMGIIPLATLRALYSGTKLTADHPAVQRALAYQRLSAQTGDTASRLTGLGQVISTLSPAELAGPIGALWLPILSDLPTTDPVFNDTALAAQIAPALPYFSSLALAQGEVRTAQPWYRKAVQAANQPGVSAPLLRFWPLALANGAVARSQLTSDLTTWLKARGENVVQRYSAGEILTLLATGEQPLPFTALTPLLEPSLQPTPAQPQPILLIAAKHFASEGQLGLAYASILPLLMREANSPASLNTQLATLAMLGAMPEGDQARTKTYLRQAIASRL